MSIYNALFGVNDEAPILLGMLGVNMEYFDRFRDVELVQSGKIIRVFTRLGGGNREGYEDTWAKIIEHKNYIKDYDDDFDSTYAYIEFSIPEEYKKAAKSMFQREPISFKDKFNKEIEDMGKPGTEASKRAEEIAKKIEDGIKSGNPFIGV